MSFVKLVEIPKEDAISSTRLCAFFKTPRCSFNEAITADATFVASSSAVCEFNNELRSWTNESTAIESARA